MVDIYNNTIHSATGAKPRQIVFNVEGMTNTEEIYQRFKELQSNVKVNLKKQSKKIEKENINLTE